MFPINSSIGERKDRGDSIIRSTRDISSILQTKLVSIVVIMETIETAPKLYELIRKVKSTAPVFAINIDCKENNSFFAVEEFFVILLQNRSVRVIIPSEEKNESCAEISSTLYGDMAHIIISA